MIENLSFKKKSPSHFCLFIPNSFSYLQKKTEEEGFREWLEKELRLFLQTEDNLKIEFFLNKHTKTSSLRSEKKYLEENELLKQAKENAFVNQVTGFFSGKIKSVKKIDKSG